MDAEKRLNESLAEQEQVALELNKIAVPYNVLAREVESDRAHVRCGEYSLKANHSGHGNRDRVRCALSRNRWPLCRLLGVC